MWDEKKRGDEEVGEGCRGRKGKVVNAPNTIK
jgi:hypothetical protein